MPGPYGAPPPPPHPYGMPYPTVMPMPMPMPMYMPGYPGMGGMGGMHGGMHPGMDPHAAAAMAQQQAMTSGMGPGMGPGGGGGSPMSGHSPGGPDRGVVGGGGRTHGMGDVVEPPSPIMGGGGGGGVAGADAAWERASAKKSSNRRGSGGDEGSDLDDSSDGGEPTRTSSPSTAAGRNHGGRSGGAGTSSGKTPGSGRRQRKQAGTERAAASMREQREKKEKEYKAGGGGGGGGGGTGASSRAEREAAMDKEAALRAAAMRRSGFHSSDSDSPTSASEAEEKSRLARRQRPIPGGGPLPKAAGAGAGLDTVGISGGGGGDGGRRSPSAISSSAATSGSSSAPPASPATGGSPVPKLKLNPVFSQSAAADAAENKLDKSTLPKMQDLSVNDAANTTTNNTTSEVRATMGKPPRVTGAPGALPPKPPQAPHMDTSELDSLMSARGAPAQAAAAAAAAANAVRAKANASGGGTSSDSDGGGGLLGLPPPSPRDPSSSGAAAGERTVLPIRLASKVTMVLGTLRIPSDVIRLALARGDVADGGGGVAGLNRRVTVDTLRAIRTIMPATADLEAIRATYVVGGANPAKASPADGFFLEMSKVPRATAKVEALIIRSSFKSTVDGLHRSLETMRDAAKQATGSESLSRLLEIVLALGNILNRDKAGASAGGGAATAAAAAAAAAAAGGGQPYKLASLAKLTEMKAETKSPSSSMSSKGGGATLLHYLAKTVEAKSAELLAFGETLGTLKAAVSGPSLAQMESNLADLRTGLGKVEGECDACSAKNNKGGGGGGGESGEADEAAFAASMLAFRESAAGELARVNELAAETKVAAGGLLTHFGPAPEGTTPDAVLRSLQSFTAAFAKATADNARAKMKKAAAAEKAAEKAAGSLTPVKE